MSNFDSPTGSPIPEPVQQALSTAATNLWKTSVWLGVAASVIATLSVASATIAGGLNRAAGGATPALPA